jgi:plasmid stability protein
MTLTIELPDNLQAALRAQANAQGVSEEGYIRRVLERDLAAPPAEGMDADHDMLQRSERAAERIRELRKGNILPEGVTIRDLIDEGRA